MVLFYLPILLFSVIVHECAHGLVALWHGDPTAKYLGRLTLNPIPHIDLYGSIILPGLLMLSGSRFLLGWAKPVPVDVRNLRGKNDSLKVAAAGPISNVLLAFGFALILSVSARVFSTLPGPIVMMCTVGILLNCVLAVFNLLPIPPLDGHWLLLRFLPPTAARFYRQIGFLGILFIFFLFLVPGVNQVLVRQPVLFLADLLLRLAGAPAELFQ
jgi:Zn-dependent protease